MACFAYSWQYEIEKDSILSLKIFLLFERHSMMLYSLFFKMVSSIILALKSCVVTEQEVLETCKHKCPNLLEFNGGDETFSSFCQ